MIVYSVTVTINEDIETDWLKWMKEIHIPHVMETGYFFDWQIQKQLIPENLINEKTFMINYLLHSFEDYKKYEEIEAPRLRDEHSKKFSGKFRAVRAVNSMISK